LMPIWALRTNNYEAAGIPGSMGASLKRWKY